VTVGGSVGFKVGTEQGEVPTSLKWIWQSGSKQTSWKSSIGSEVGRTSAETNTILVSLLSPYLRCSMVGLLSRRS